MDSISEVSSHRNDTTFPACLVDFKRKIIPIIRENYNNIIFFKTLDRMLVKVAYLIRILPNRRLYSYNNILKKDYYEL